MKLHYVTGLYRSRPCMLKISSHPVSSCPLASELKTLISLHDDIGEAYRYIVRPLGMGVLSFSDGTLLIEGDQGSDGDDHACVSAPSDLTRRALALELGGMNLQQFMENNSALDIVHRIHIMWSLVLGMSALHRAGMVHMDVKPANIVCFGYPEEGVMRWKFVDWDCSRHEGSSISSGDTQVTPAYAPPELMKHIRPSSSLPSSPLPFLRASWMMDMWSLGLTFLFLLRSQEIWHLLNPPASESEVPSRLLSLSQTDIDHMLAAVFRGKEKERSILEACLQTNPHRRATAHSLVDKSLFTTGMATMHASTLTAINEGQQELKKGQQELKTGQQELKTGVKEVLSKLDQVLLSLSEGFRDVKRGVTQTLQGLTKLSLTQEDSQHLLRRVSDTLTVLCAECQERPSLTVSEARDLLERMNLAVTEAVEQAVTDAVSMGCRDAGDRVLLSIGQDLSHMREKMETVKSSLDSARADSSVSAEALQGAISKLAQELEEVRDSTQRLLVISEGLQQSRCDLSLSMLELKMQAILSSTAVRDELITATDSMGRCVTSAISTLQQAIDTGRSQSHSDTAGLLREFQTSLGDSMSHCQHEHTLDLKASLASLSRTIEKSCSSTEALDPLVSLLSDIRVDLGSLSRVVGSVSLSMEEIHRQLKPLMGMVKSLLLGGHSVPCLPLLTIEPPETTLAKMKGVFYVSSLPPPPLPISLSQFRSLSSS